MTTNLLLPNSADDLACALYDELRDPDPRWREPVLRRLAQELRSNPAHSVPVGALPAFAPPWATVRPLHQLMPGAQVRRDLVRVTACLARAEAPPPRLERANSTLARRCAELPDAFEHERWPDLTRRATQLLDDLDSWLAEEDHRRALNRRLRPAATVPARSKRYWLRARSLGALLAQGRGGRWCVLDEDEVATGYHDRFVVGELTFWTLHDAEGEPLALLSHTEDGAVEEVRGRTNERAPEFRADILRLVRAGYVNLDEPSADVEVLAIDPHLGRRGQPFIEGVLSGRHCAKPIRYRLWCDGRRRRYLLATGTDGRPVPNTWLRLDASPKRAKDATLNGAVQPAWTGEQSGLMNAALADAFPKATRPAHVVRAMRYARAAW